MTTDHYHWVPKTSDQQGAGWAIYSGQSHFLVAEGAANSITVGFRLFQDLVVGTITMDDLDEGEIANWPSPWAAQSAPVRERIPGSGGVMDAPILYAIRNPDGRIEVADEREISAWLITAGLHSSTIKKLKAFGYTCVKGKFVEDGAANH